MAGGGDGNALVVVSTTSAPSLTAADFSVSLPNTIQLNDNARAVVVVGIGETGPGVGIDAFELWFVQDSDSGSGQSWQVDRVARVTPAAETDLADVTDNLLGGLGLTGGAADERFQLGPGEQSVDLVGDSSGSDTVRIDTFDADFDGPTVAVISGFRGAGADGDPQLGPEEDVLEFTNLADADALAGAIAGITFENNGDQLGEGNAVDVLISGADGSEYLFVDFLPAGVDVAGDLGLTPAPGGGDGVLDDPFESATVEGITGTQLLDLLGASLLFSG
jgi:hypothetical protein